MIVYILHVHPDGTPDEVRLKAPRITYKTWPVPGSLVCLARVAIYDRRNRVRESRVYAAVVTIRRTGKVRRG